MQGEVEIPIGRLRLQGSLYLPEDAAALVVFAHGSGSRNSPRNRFVAARIQAAGFGTLLFDLLTSEEDRVCGNRFDIDRLTGRLETAAQWFLIEARPQQIALGFFGASTGAIRCAVCGGADGRSKCER